MQKIALMSLSALVVLLGSACSAAGPTAGQAGQPTATAEPAGVAAQPTATTPAATQSAGNATEVEITLADNTITSSLTAFKVGVPYTFVIKNTGRHEHNFNINEPIAVTGSLDASLSSALLAVDQKDIPIGGSETVQYTFADTAIGKTLEFSCLIRRHYDDGMRLAITVTN